jgi:hypothetical protein
VKPTESGRNSGLPDLRKQTKERLSERGRQKPPGSRTALRAHPQPPRPPAGAEHQAGGSSGWSPVGFPALDFANLSCPSFGVEEAPTHMERGGATGVAAWGRWAPSSHLGTPLPLGKSLSRSLQGESPSPSPGLGVKSRQYRFVWGRRLLLHAVTQPE